MISSAAATPSRLSRPPDSSAASVRYPSPYHPPGTEQQPFGCGLWDLTAGLMPQQLTRAVWLAVAVTRGGKSAGGGGAADKVKDCLGSVPVVGKVVEKVVGKGKSVPVQRMER